MSTSRRLSPEPQLRAMLLTALAAALHVSCSSMHLRNRPSRDMTASAGRHIRFKLDSHWLCRRLRRPF